MPDSLRKGQPTAVQIPVIIQGSKSVEGTDRRELFVEKTKTELIFDNGAVLSLKSRVQPGQCVFLRSEVSGKEILCKVLESPQEGPPGYTDLEFNVYEPEFWGDALKRPETAEPKAEAQKGNEAAEEKPAAASKAESGAPISTELPATSASASPETRETSPERTNEPESNDAETAAQLPALVTVDAKHPGKQETAAGESQETEPEAEPKDAAEEGETSSEIEDEKKDSYAASQEPIRIPNFKARKIAAAISVAVAIIVVTVQVYEWHARYKHVNPGSHRAAFSLKAKQQSSTDKMLTAQAPATVNSTSQTTGKSASDAAGQGLSNPAGSAPAPVAQKAQQPAGKQDRGVVAMQDARASARTREEAKRGKSKDANAGETIPAKIVLESQPPIPSWAKKLDLDDVVQLDAVIDEKGNLTSTRPLSGPRLLQREAERAVALWIFEPAMTDGKPTATHMVLTVQFQR